MNSTLKPHLLVEVIGLQRERMFPQKLCRLFLAYRNFSEVFALAFRHRGTVRHYFYEARDYRNPNFTVKTKSGIVFQFTKEYHVPALLRIAGRLIQTHDGDCHDEKWLEPFFKGLDENKCLELVGANCSNVFVHKYLRKHDVLPKVVCHNFAKLNGLKNKTIDTLLVNSRYVMSDESSSNTEQIRVNNIEISCYHLRVNPLKTRSKTLTFDKKFLKRLFIDGKMNPESAARMIVCYSMAEEIEFQQVIIPWQLGRKPMFEIFDRLKAHVDHVWQAVVRASGQVNVTALYTRDLPGTLADMAKACHTYLKGYNIFTDNATRAIMTKKQGNKTLEVRIALWPPKLTRIPPMNSTLKPHLFVEVTGLQRECLSPLKLCGLFLADNNFSEVFAHAFRHPCQVRHRYRDSRSNRLPFFDDYYIGYDRPGLPFPVKTKSGIFFQFTKKYHIPALLRIAGRLIQKHDEDCLNEKWLEPFFQGLDENKCLESIGCYCSKVFLQKYLRSHDVLLNVECNNFAMLDDLNYAKIDTLKIRAPLGRECFENDFSRSDCFARSTSPLLQLLKSPSIDLRQCHTRRGLLIYGKVRQK